MMRHFASWYDNNDNEYGDYGSYKNINQSSYDTKFMQNNYDKNRVPYYQDQIFDNLNYERQKQSEYDPLDSFTQENNQQRSKLKKKFYIKPFSIYNFEEKQFFTLRPRNAIYQNTEDVMRHKHVGYMIMKITPMEEVIDNEKSTNDTSLNKSNKKQYAPDYTSSCSFVLTSKNIGGVLAMKTTNEIKEYEVKEQILDSTTSRSQKEDFLTLLKLEKKLKQEPTEDNVEFEISYFEIKDDQILKSTSITLTLGQMIVLKML